MPEISASPSASPFGLTGKNLFAYCDNNPVTRKDKSGHVWVLATRALVGLASVYVADIVTNLMNGKTGLDVLKPISSAGTYAGGAISGMIPGGGFGGALTRTIVNVGVKYGVDVGILKKEVTPYQVTMDVVSNLIGEGLSMGVEKVLQSARPRNYSSFKQGNYCRHQMV